MNQNSSEKLTSVLIVEDEMIIAQDIARISENCGYKVLDIVASGENAVKIAEKRKPDVVLMDILLEDEMTGLVAAEKIYKSTDVPIVFITSYADDNTIHKSKTSQPFGYIIKPFDERELKAVVELALYKFAMQKTLQKTSEKYKRIFENIQDVYCEMELDGTIIEISPSIEVMSCYKRDELIDKKIDKLITEQDQIDTFFNLLKKNKCVRDLEVTIKDDDETITYFSVISKIIYDESVKRSKIVSSFHDISEHKRLEKRLLRAERLAGVGQLAAGIAHEIRNPLGNISSSIQYCLKKYKLPDELVQYLEIVLRNSQNANKIIKELLDFATPREIYKQKGNLHSILKHSIKLVEARLKQNNVNIKLDVEKNLPDINLDSKWIEQTFINFILNANDAMIDGGELEIRMQKKEDMIEVQFSDNGCGIASQDIEKVFDPFYTTKDNGTGLGLSFVYQVIAAHDGDVDVHSKIDEGTKFTITLPIV